MTSNQELKLQMLGLLLDSIVVFDHKNKEFSDIWGLSVKEDFIQLNINSDPEED